MYHKTYHYLSTYKVLYVHVCFYILGTVFLGLGALLFALPHFTTGTYLPTEEIIDGNVCSNRTGRMILLPINPYTH